MERIPEDLGTGEFVFLSLYRLKTMSDEEKYAWFKSWADIKRNLPKGMKIVTEAANAFGTDFTGFTVFEGPLDKYEELISILEDHSGHLVEKSLTIIGTKDITLPISKVEKIVSSRPID